MKTICTPLLFLFAISFSSALANAGSAGEKITLDQAYDLTLRSDESILEADAGESLRSDVLSAQVTLESDRQLLIQAQNTLRSDRNKLCNNLSIPHDSDFSVVEPEPYPSKLPAFETLLAQALRHREDLKVKALMIDQDIEGRAEVKGEYAPKLVAQVDINYNRISGSADSRTSSWDAGLSVSVPFLTGGQREIDLRNASYTINGDRLGYSAQAKSVEQDINDAWLNVQTLGATIRSLRTEVSSAEQEYEETENQYRAGTSTSIEVLNALNSLNTARRDLATSTYDYQVALRNIEETTGVFQEQRIESLKFR